MCVCVSISTCQALSETSTADQSSALKSLALIIVENISYSALIALFDCVKLKCVCVCVVEEGQDGSGGIC